MSVLWPYKATSLPSERLIQANSILNNGIQETIWLLIQMEQRSPFFFEENLMISITNICFPLQLKNAGTSSFASWACSSHKATTLLGWQNFHRRLPNKLQTSKSKAFETSTQIYPEQFKWQNKKPPDSHPCVSLKMGCYLHPLFLFSHTQLKKL